MQVLNEYKRVHNLVRKETRTRTQTFQLDTAKACKYNPKKFWQYIKSKTTTISNVSDIQITNGCKSRTVTDDLAKAEVFAKFFSDIYTDEQDLAYTKLSARKPPNSMPKICITETMVMNKLSELKVDKSPGPDMLHPRVLYEVRQMLAPFLTHLFNTSLQEATVPDDWKHSTITVLHKKG
jgi:hypothetical protein